MHSDRYGKYPLQGQGQAGYSSWITQSSNVMTGDQILHHNNIMAQNRDLIQANQLLQLKIDKYQQLEPYIDSLIDKNTSLQQTIENQKIQTNYLIKSIRQLHVQSKNTTTHYESKLKQQQSTVQTLKQTITQLKFQKQSQTTIITVLSAQTDSYKRKLQQTLTQKIEQEQKRVIVQGQRDRLIGQMRQLQNYNKQLARNSKGKQDQYMVKLEQKDRMIKDLQIQRNEYKNKSQKMKQNTMHKQLQILQLEQNYVIVLKDHEVMMEEIRGLRLKIVQLEQICEDYSGKIGKRQEQLAEVQMFREQERDIYKREFNKIQNIFQQDKQEYRKAIQHKSIKIQKLTQTHSQLIDSYNVLQTELEELGKQYEHKYEQVVHCQKILEQNHNIYQHNMREMQEINERLSLQVKEDIGEIQNLNKNIQQIQHKYCQREDQFQDFAAQLTHKFESQKIKWQQFYENEKTKLKNTHIFQLRQAEGSYLKKLGVLERDIEDYRQRCRRLESGRNTSTQKLNARALPPQSSRKNLQNSVQRDRKPSQEHKQREQLHSSNNNKYH